MSPFCVPSTPLSIPLAELLGWKRMTTREAPNPNVYSEGSAAGRCLAVARQQQHLHSAWQKARRRDEEQGRPKDTNSFSFYSQQKG